MGGDGRRYKGKGGFTASFLEYSQKLVIEPLEERVVLDHGIAHELALAPDGISSDPLVIQSAENTDPVLVDPLGPNDNPIYIYDHTLGTATPVTGAVSGTISTGDDVDLWYFGAAAGQVLTVDVNAWINGSGLNAVIRFFDGSGNPLVINDDPSFDPAAGGVGSLDPYFKYVLPSSGAYYVGISSYGNVTYNPTGAGSGYATGSTTGTYGIGLSLDTPQASGDPSGTLSGAASLPLSLDTPYTRTESITSSDVDMFVFTAPAGALLTMDVDAFSLQTSQLNPVLRLFDVDGNSFILQDNSYADPDTGRTNSIDPYLEYVIPTAGNYWVGISSYGNQTYNPAGGGSGYIAGSSTGTYQVTVALFGLDADPGGTTGGAQNLSLAAGTAVERFQMISSNEVDLYSFTGVAGWEVYIEANAFTMRSSLNPVIRLFDSGGNPLVINDNAASDPDAGGGYSTDSVIRYTFTSSGTYYIGVSSAGNIAYNVYTGAGAAGGSTTGYYDLRTSLLPPATLGDPAHTMGLARGLFLDPDQLYNRVELLGDSGQGANDIDVFSFYAGYLETIEVDIDARLLGNNPDLVLRLFDYTGTQVTASTVDDSIDPDTGVWGLDPHLRYQIPASGTYYLGVSAFNNTSYTITGGTGISGGTSTGPYRLEIIRHRPELTGDAIGSTAAAMGLNLDPGYHYTHRGRLAVSTDVDTFGFYATAGQVIDIDIDAFETINNTLDPLLRILDSNGAQVSRIEDSVSDPDKRIMTSTGAAESHDPQVRWLIQNTGTYYLEVSPGVQGGTGFYSMEIDLVDSTVLPAAPASAQTVWVNFGGGGSFLGYSITSFTAAYWGLDGSQQQPLINLIMQYIRDDYVWSGSMENPRVPLNFAIDFTTVQPSSGSYSRLHIGDSTPDPIFFLGLASYNLNNTNKNDSGIVPTDLFTGSMIGGGGELHMIARSLANTASHEIGHVLGLTSGGDAHHGSTGHGLLMQSGSFDLNRVDDERFGIGSDGNDITALQANLVDALDGGPVLMTHSLEMGHGEEPHGGGDGHEFNSNLYAWSLLEGGKGHGYSFRHTTPEDNDSPNTNISHRLEHGDSFDVKDVFDDRPALLLASPERTDPEQTGEGYLLPEGQADTGILTGGGIRLVSLASENPMEIPILTGSGVTLLRA